DVIDLAPVTVDVREEGQTSTIWSGQVTFITSTIVDSDGASHDFDRPTALGALDAAASAGGFSYVASPAWGSLYISEVAGEAPAGMDGWMYRVDWISPDVGAGNYVLGPSQTVLWYYAAWGAKPMRLMVDSDVLEQGQTLTATVDAYDDMTSTWGPVEGATLYVDSVNYTTDASGQVIISLSAGYYTLYAGKETYATYTRSNRVNVDVHGPPFTLYPGWNFVSVPRKLAPGFDTAEQLFGEVDTAGHSIFQYSPASGWTPIGAGDVVSPLDGIWVFSTSQQTLQLPFDTMPRRVPPTKQLGAGWNAIGFANLSPLSANSTLTSVESKWSILIGFNAQTRSYESSIINNHVGGVHDESTAMDIWKGYWLYMNSGGELAAISP
ncbi:MAG: DUF4430 domain-containing protein, partial [Dehalococcoidia bacterium]